MRVLASKIFETWKATLEFLDGTVKRRSTFTEDQGAGPGFTITDSAADFSTDPAVEMGDYVVRVQEEGTKTASVVAAIPEDTTTLDLAVDLEAEEGEAYVIKSPPISEEDLFDVREEGRGCYHVFYYRDDGITVVE